MTRASRQIQTAGSFFYGDDDIDGDNDYCDRYNDDCDGDNDNGDDGDNKVLLCRFFYGWHDFIRTRCPLYVY